MAFPCLRAPTVEDNQTQGQYSSAVYHTRHQRQHSLEVHHTPHQRDHSSAVYHTPHQRDHSLAVYHTPHTNVTTAQQSTTPVYPALKPGIDPTTVNSCQSTIINVGDFQKVTECGRLFESVHSHSNYVLHAQNNGG